MSPGRSLSAIETLLLTTLVVDLVISCPSIVTLYSIVKVQETSTFSALLEAVSVPVVAPVPAAPEKPGVLQL